jgi:hypothetical protein
MLHNSYAGLPTNEACSFPLKQNISDFASPCKDDHAYCYWYFKFLRGYKVPGTGNLRGAKNILSNGIRYRTYLSVLSPKYVGSCIRGSYSAKHAKNYSLPCHHFIWEKNSLGYFSKGQFCFQNNGFITITGKYLIFPCLKFSRQNKNCFFFKEIKIMF